MKRYLEKFILPTQEAEEGALNCVSGVDSQYPFGIFGWKEFSQIDFAPVTIFYGGNGSGKSTLLNVMTEVLAIRRIAPRNDSELFQNYCELCDFKTGWDEDYNIPLNVPSGSALLTSDDVFEYMNAVRMHNDKLDEQYEKAYNFYQSRKKPNPVKKGVNLLEQKDLLDDLCEDNYELRREILQKLSRSHTEKAFAIKMFGNKTLQKSNGQTALEFFNKKIKDEKLYLLDEPENSLSPRLQLELIKILEESVRYCDCQLVIATHSPLLLSMEGAKIYDLDETPVDIKNWYELENVKIYFEHFYKNRRLFEK
jgi:predicted ATPase